jgi:hypothetical protein
LLEIDGVFVLSSKSEEEIFVLEELLKTEKGIRLTHKQLRGTRPIHNAEAKW